MVAANNSLVAPRERTRADLQALIQRNDGVTRSGLVELSGLSRSTVVHAVRGLIAAGLVVERAPGGKGPGTGSGRAGARLSAVGSGRHLAAVDLGHAHITVAIGDELGTALAEETVDLDIHVDAVTVLDLAAAMVERLRVQLGVAELAGAVMGLPLPIGSDGRVNTALAAGSWSGIDVAEQLEQRLGVAIHLENDALLGAVGEFRSGSGRGLHNVLYVKASHGIGAAFILQGAPYRGSRGLAGDLGHDKVPGRSELCRCGGRGCVEAVASWDAVRDQVLHTQSRWNHADLQGEPDDVGVRILTEAGRTVGRSIAQVCNMLDLDAVVIGGRLVELHRSFLDGVEWSVRELGRQTVAADMRVVRPTLGTRSAVIGGLHMAADLIQSSPADGPTLASTALTSSEPDTLVPGPFRLMNA